MENSMPLLYSYFRSSCSWRVRIALALKNVDYEYKAVSLVKNGGEQHSADFAKMNPMKQVPVFVEDGNVLSHSMPIIEYLEETRPSFPLLPSDSVLRAKVRGVVDTIASGIQPLQNVTVLNCVGENKNEWAKHWIEEGFMALEEQLRPIHGSCCVGNDITIADLCLVPQVYNANRFGVDMAQFPVISDINSYLSKHEAFKCSHPAMQPDSPKDLVQ